jgi:hypothetical protein
MTKLYVLRLVLNDVIVVLGRPSRGARIDFIASWCGYYVRSATTAGWVRQCCRTLSTVCPVRTLQRRYVLACVRTYTHSPELSHQSTQLSIARTARQGTGPRTQLTLHPAPTHSPTHPFSHPPTHPHKHSAVHASACKYTTTTYLPTHRTVPYRRVARVSPGASDAF